MKVSVYGAGYVGLVSAACFAKMGHEVVCMDVNAKRVAGLQSGACPIYEAQLPQLLEEQCALGRLSFTNEATMAIHHSAIHVIATGTPSMADGQADLSQVFAVATTIIEQTQQEVTLITKSTVPVGTGDNLEKHLSGVNEKRANPVRFRVLSNPEFLREGSAVVDFMKADRVIIGGDEDGCTLLKEFYAPLDQQNIPIVCMGRTSAELTKYASNAMLACRISFINQMSQIAEKTGANIDEIAQGMGLEHRIGPHFLQAGIGYGGSCFPKDTRALTHSANQLGVDALMFEAIEAINERQKQWPYQILSAHFKNQLSGLTIGLWGLAFKPDTDDVREASSLVLIHALLKAGAQLLVYDPVAQQSMRQRLDNDANITWCASCHDVLKGIDALVIATEWQAFKRFSLTDLADALGRAPLVDGRNCYQLEDVKKAKINYYYSVGRPTIITTKLHNTSNNLEIDE